MRNVDFPYENAVTPAVFPREIGRNPSAKSLAQPVGDRTQHLFAHMRRRQFFIGETAGFVGDAERIRLTKHSHGNARTEVTFAALMMRCGKGPRFLRREPW